MAKRTPAPKPAEAPTAAQQAPVEEPIEDRAQSLNVEPEKVENSATEQAKQVSASEMETAAKPEAASQFEDAAKVKLKSYNPATQIVVDRKLFNKMITTLCLGKGLMFYTGQGLTTQLGELLGLKKNEPGFYDKARTLMHDIMAEHQRG